MISFITGVRFTDTLCGTKAFNRDLIEKYFNGTKSKKIHPGILICCLPNYFIVAEYPVNYDQEDRKHKSIDLEMD